MRKYCYLLLNLFLLPQLFYGQQVFPYQQPSKELTALFTGTGDEGFIFSTDGKKVIRTQRLMYPSVEDIAFSPFQAAGLYVNTKNFSQGSQQYISSLAIKDLATGKENVFSGLPQPLRADNISWNGDGKKLAFTQTSRDRVDLYVIDMMSYKATKVNKQPLHLVQGKAYEWMPDNSLLYKIIVQPAAKAPSKNSVPAGAFVFDTKNETYPGNMYATGVQSAFDEESIVFYLTAQLVHNKAGKEIPLGKPALYNTFSLSPDGKYILCNLVQQPFSSSLRFDEFPSSLRVLDNTGKLIKELVQLPASGWQKRPRFFEWRPDMPSTITWQQPIDTGSVKKQEFSTILYAWDAPFTQSPRVLFKTRLQMASVIWGVGGIALVNERDRKRGIHRINIYNDHTKKLDSIYQQESYDLKKMLGMPVTTRDRNGREMLVLLDSGKSFLINNPGGNDASNGFPFLATWNLEAKGLQYIWKATNTKELVSQVGNAEKLLLLMRRSGDVAGYEYFLWQLNGSLNTNYVLAVRKIDPPFDSATSQIIQYKRADGVTLAGSLILPKGYDPAKDGRLPLFIWSYPRRFYTRDEYSPEKASEKRYGIRIDTWEAPEMFVCRGYAVFYAGMPVLPDSNENANDKFIEQIVMNAEAAIKKLADDGIADPHRVAVGGHSYGAGMTALLLANTNLFKAGIAMSGDYNRLQSPFGFQEETRNYWQAREVYERLSAIRYADKIKTPLLLIHGTHDDTQGTLPQESANLYKAIKGTGGTVRYVSLPWEGHGYRAKENILQLLWEMEQWMNKYLKNETSK